MGTTGGKADGCLQTALSARKGLDGPMGWRPLDSPEQSLHVARYMTILVARMEDALQRKEIGGRDINYCVQITNLYLPPKQNLPALRSTSPKAMCVCLRGAEPGHGAPKFGILGAQTPAFHPTQPQPSPSSAPAMTSFGPPHFGPRSGCQQWEEA